MESKLKTQLIDITKIKENENNPRIIRHEKFLKLVELVKNFPEMLQNGWKDEEICNELGMQPEEVLKLKHITGFSKLFQDTEYRKSWEETSQLRLRKKYLEDQKETQTEEVKPNPKPDGRKYKV